MPARATRRSCVLTQERDHGEHDPSEQRHVPVYEIAKQRRLPGRSKLGKSDLIDAIRERR